MDSEDDIKTKDNSSSLIYDSPEIKSNNRRSIILKSEKKIYKYFKENTNYDEQIKLEMDKTRRLCANYRLDNSLPSQNNESDDQKSLIDLELTNILLPQSDEPKLGLSSQKSSGVINKNITIKTPMRQKPLKKLAQASPMVSVSDNFNHND